MNTEVSSVGLSLYKMIAKTGVLDTNLFKSAFARAYFAYKRFCEDPYFNLARRHRQLFAGGHVLDVGANIGYTAVVFAEAIDDGYKVYAFEPEAKNFAQLQATVAGRRLQLKIEPIACAIGSRSETLDLWVNPFHPGDHRILTEALRQTLGAKLALESVKVESIDSFVEGHLHGQNVSFIKIDVQGYEPLVCQGLTGTLEKYDRVSVSFEYFPQAMKMLGVSHESLLEVFLDRGFHLYVINNDGSLDPWRALQQTENLKRYIEVLACRQRL